jgi:uncharacterized Zn-binding protein involved in type VI secretion
MPAVQRVGDADGAGGVASGGVGSVRVNGRAVIVNGNSVSAHPCCGRKGCPPIHCSATTAGGSGSVRAGGIPVVYTGASDTCGHARAGGSDNVRVAA